MRFYARIQMRVNILLKLGDEPMYLKRLKDLREDFDKKQHEIADEITPYINSNTIKKDIPSK